MPQIHSTQHGIFHITTASQDRIPWCVFDGIPRMLIDNLCMTRTVQRARLHAFCILPDHLHLILTPGPQGLSTWMQSFKTHASREIHQVFPPSDDDDCAAAVIRHPPRRLWQKSFYDERIRSSSQCSAAMQYVLGNGMKHGLVSEASDWPWTSHHFPDLVDRIEVWL